MLFPGTGWYTLIQSNIWRLQRIPKDVVPVIFEGGFSIAAAVLKNRGFFLPLKLSPGNSEPAGRDSYNKRADSFLHLFIIKNIIKLTAVPDRVQGYFNSTFIRG